MRKVWFYGFLALFSFLFMGADECGTDHDDLDEDGYVVIEDCNDTDPEVYPGAVEVCDSKDDDCDGQIDEGWTTIWYQDVDGDGYGADLSYISSCVQPEGFTSEAGDCNEVDPDVYPGAEELCNGRDNDCDGVVSDGLPSYTYYPDGDGDGHGAVSPAMLASCESETPVGFSEISDDCNDADPTIYLGATEICDVLDNDCDGQMDEGVTTTYHRDFDGDGYGNDQQTATGCEPSMDGYIVNGGDCNDADPSVYPGAVEWVTTTMYGCDGIDRNCDGGDGTPLYYDWDEDEYGGTLYIIMTCPVPYWFQPPVPWEYMTDIGEDCDDTDSAVNPGVEELGADGLDNDCDGWIDES